jgi:hypothetical protein
MPNVPSNLNPLAKRQWLKRRSFPDVFFMVKRVFQIDQDVI